MNLEFFKKHPAGSAIAAVGVFVVVYYLSSSGSSGAASSSGSSNPTLALAQLQAATNAQNAQVSAQMQQTQLQAQVANNQISAQANETAQNAAAQIAGLKIQTQGSVDINNSNNNVLLTQLNDASAVETMQLQTVAQTQQTQYNDELAAVQTQYGYMGQVAGLQAGVATQAIQSQTQVALNHQNNQFNLSNQALQLVKQAGLNHGTATLENSLTQITETALGDPQNTATIGSNGPSSAAQIIAGIGQASGNVLGALFL